MAINGPLVPSDLNVTAIIDGLRTQSVWLPKTASFTISTREGEGFIISGSTAITITAPPANDTDLKVGSKFYIINDSMSTVTINPNSSGSVGSLGAGLSALLVLKDNSTVNGLWELIQFDKDDNTGVTPYTTDFNNLASPAVGADWSAAVAGSYSYTVTKGTHMKGNNPIVIVYSTAGDEILVKTNRVPSGTNIGNVIITVSEVPSGLFSGTIVII